MAPKDQGLNSRPGIIKIVQALALIGFALVIYRPSFNAQFHFDDLTSIIQNPYIRIADLRPSSLFQAAVQDRVQNRPLTNLTLALNFYFSRLDPFGYHLFNFFLLLITAAGVWLLLEKLFVLLGHARARSELAAWATALVWTAHPLNTQAITYIVQRSVSLAGAFSVWSIYFYHLARERNKPRPHWYVLCALFCLAAMLSKESAAVLPALIFGYGLYFFDGFSQGWLKRNWKWMLGLAIFYLLAAGIVLRPEILAKLAEDFAKTHFNAWEKLISGPRVLVWYFFLILFPFPQFLNLIHDYPVSRSFLNPWTTAPCLALVSAIILAAFYGARRWKVFSFCAAWYFGNLLIEAMPIPIDLVNEHRLYLASLGIIAPLAAWPVLKFKNLKPALALVLAIALMLGFFSWRRNLVWKTEDSLWKDVLHKAPMVSRTWNDYCTAMIERGDIRKAGQACRYAVAINPEDSAAQSNLGICLFQSGKYNEAEKHFRTAIEQYPDYAVAYFNLGLVKIAQGDLEGAKAYLEKAGQTATSDARMYFNLGSLYQRLGEPEKALSAFFTALKLRPEWAEARLETASILAEQGRCPEAVQLINAAPDPDQRFEQIISKCR